MNAKIAEIKSKFHTAISNVRISKAAYKHAIETGLGDEVNAMTARSLELLEISIINSSHVIDGLVNSSGPDLLQFIPIAEEYADKALKESDTALKKMQVAVTAATENEDCEEPAKKKAKKDEAKEGEASNKPGGSNA